MSSPSAIVCREIFDENSQPSAEEISEYAHQLGIDPESESHLLPLAKEGLMQALPAPWKAYFDEKLQTHYYYNEETKKTQWEHPLDNVYRELVKRARDASIQDDTCASVQELLTSEENTKNLERVETKADSDDEFSTDSEKQPSDIKDNPTLIPKRLAPLGRPPLAPLGRLDKKLSELKISPLRRSAENPKPFIRNISDRDLLSRPVLERPKMLFKQQSEIIDLKMHVLTSPEEENFSPLLGSVKGERGLPLTGKGSMFFRASKSDLPSPDTDKSLHIDSMTKSDPPKGILREKLSDSFQRKAEAAFGRARHAASLDEDKKSVRFKLENLPDPPISPSSNSSSDQNEQSSIVASIPGPALPSPLIPSSPISSPPILPIPPISVPSINPSIVLSPLANRPPLPPRPTDGPRDVKSTSGSDKDSVDGTSPRRRLIKPPAVDYIKPDLFQKSFQKIADLVRPGDIEPPTNLLLDEPRGDKDVRPRSPMIPQQKNKISINLMESIESETSIDSPDKEFANLDLNDLDLSEDQPEGKDLERDQEKDSFKLEEKENNIDEKPKSEIEINIPVIDEKLSPIVERSKTSNAENNSSFKFERNSPRREPSFPLDSSRNNSYRVERNSPRIEGNTSSRTDEKDTSRTEETSEKTTSKTSNSSVNKSPFAENISVPQIKVPALDLSKTKVPSDSDDSKRPDDRKTPRSASIDIKPPQVKISPTPSTGSDLKSPRYDFNKPWNSLSTFKPLNKAVIAPLKTSDSASSLGKGLTSPRLDGVIISQDKSNDNVVVVYQFESQEENSVKPIKSPLVPDVAARDMIERSKADERKRLELSLQKELESIRAEFAAKERRMRAELLVELREAEEKFVAEKRLRLAEQAEKHKKEIEEALESSEQKHKEYLEKLQLEMEERRRRDTEAAERRHREEITKLQEMYQGKLGEMRSDLETEHEHALTELRAQFAQSLQRERAALTEHNRAALTALRDDHAARVQELRNDYRAEVERLRTQHACHLEELRARLANERLAPRNGHTTSHADSALQDKYRCLKEKYARLKHDVKMSIERRNKRREMSMTTGSETEKSNSHKQTQSLERCKEVNEISVSAVIEPEPRSVTAANNNTSGHCQYNDNETSQSDSNALKSSDNNNQHWRQQADNSAPPTSSSQVGSKKSARRSTVAFREPAPRAKSRHTAAVTDYQDSSDATTADEKPKEILNGHGRRRCFTRLKSASTSRLNYSPKRGEGWSSPLEALRQQLRKLDDLEDQFPDLACQPSYSLRYPFAELGGVSCGEVPELEFVRHRALVEREGMRRARAALRTRRAALRDTNAATTRPPEEEREATELEVALHRARALLGEKEIRLRHIERALRRFTEPHPPPPLIQEATTSEASSGSEGAAEEREATGAVLRSLRALHADVRDIWRALDARPRTASPETSSCNAPSTSHPRMTLSAPDPVIHPDSDSGVQERARGLRAWLQTH